MKDITSILRLIPIAENELQNGKEYLLELTSCRTEDCQDNYPEWTVGYYYKSMNIFHTEDYTYHPNQVNFAYELPRKESL